MEMLLCFGGQLLINNQRIPLGAVDYKCCTKKSQWHGGGAMATSQGLHLREISCCSMSTASFLSAPAELHPSIIYNHRCKGAIFAPIIHTILAVANHYECHYDIFS
jgi:hypothetical protein